MSKTPTIMDVARAANVSRQTVSNVINAPDVVRPATRQRVEAAIHHLRYRPHASARRLRTRRAATLGVRLDPVSANGISGSVLDGFLHALTEHADQRNIRILLYTADSPQREIEQCQRLLDGSDVDGFVLTSTVHRDPRIAWLTENTVPFVSFGRPWGVRRMDDPKYRWVDVDGRAGVAAAVRALRSTGAERVGFIGWPPLSGIGDERRRGWLETCGVGEREAGSLEMAVEDETSAATEAASHLLGAQAPPDAFVCASDSLALGARMAVAAHGSDAPVVGFDDTPVADAVGFSSIRQPLDEVARAALELLMGPDGDRVVDDPRTLEGPTFRLVEPELIIRTRERGKA